MKNASEKIETALSEKRVKLHLFEPSNRKIWTIVGQGEEHWLDPSFEFCSCLGYYFGKLEGRKGCYHVDSIKLAKNENKFETIKFSDDEFEDFISSLVDDM